MGTEGGHGCPSPLSHLAPPCHRAGLTWLLSEPTRLPSTGANREVHIRFWGERLSRVSPGRLKATGLACGGEGRGRLRHGDQAPICLGLTSSLSQTQLHPPGVWEARGTRVRENPLKHRRPSPGHISRSPASLMPLEAGRAKAGPGSLGAPLTLGCWVAVALWDPSGMSVSRAWVPPEATSSSEIIRTWVGAGHQEARHSPRASSLSQTASKSWGSVFPAPRPPSLTCPTPHVLLWPATSRAAWAVGAREEGAGRADGQHSSVRAYPPLGEFAERHGPVADVPDSRLHKVCLGLCLLLWAQCGHELLPVSCDLAQEGPGLGSGPENDKVFHLNRGVFIAWCR